MQTVILVLAFEMCCEREEKCASRWLIAPDVLNHIIVSIQRENRTILFANRSGKLLLISTHLEKTNES